MASYRTCRLTWLAFDPVYKPVETAVSASTFLSDKTYRIDVLDLYASEIQNLEYSYVKQKSGSSVMVQG